MPRSMPSFFGVLCLLAAFFVTGSREAAAQDDLDLGCIYMTSASYNAELGKLRVTSRGAGQYFLVAGFQPGYTWIQNVGMLPLSGQIIVLKSGSSASCANNVSDFNIGGPYGFRGYLTTVWLGLDSAVITPGTPVDI